MSSSPSSPQFIAWQAKLLWQKKKKKKNCGEGQEGMLSRHYWHMRGGTILLVLCCRIKRHSISLQIQEETHICVCYIRFRSHYPILITKAMDATIVLRQNHNRQKNVLWFSFLSAALSQQEIQYTKQSRAGYLVYIVFQMTRTNDLRKSGYPPPGLGSIAKKSIA